MPEVEEHLEETKDEEVTKEAIMAMYAHCNIVELDEETSVLVEGKTNLKLFWGGSSSKGINTSVTSK